MSDLPPARMVIPGKGIPRFARCCARTGIPAARHGFSLIEVMLAVTILASALTVMVGSFITSQQARELAHDQVLAQEVGRSILMRLQGAPTNQLGIPAWGWGLARHEDAGDTPLSDAPGTAANDDLIALGLRTTPSNLIDLEVFIEYYRGTDSPDPSTGIPALQPGVLDSFAVGNDPSLSYSSFSNQVWRQARRLASAVPPANQVPANTSVVIRVIVRWNQINNQNNNRNSGRIELFGGRLF